MSWVRNRPTPRQARRARRRRQKLRETRAHVCLCPKGRYGARSTWRCDVCGSTWSTKYTGRLRRQTWRRPDRRIA